MRATASDASRLAVEEKMENRKLSARKRSTSHTSASVQMNGRKGIHFGAVENKNENPRFLGSPSSGFSQHVQQPFYFRIFRLKALLREPILLT